MKSVQSLIIAVAVLVTGCAPPGGGGPQQKNPFQYVYDDSSDGLDSLIRFLKDEGATCTSPDYTQAGNDLAELAKAPQIPQFVTMQIELTFGLADAALDKNCLPQAELYYRLVIERYIGSDYAAYRERASIGLDDVREKKGSVK